MTPFDYVLVMIIVLPLAAIWLFALIDILRRDDVSGVWKVIWLLLVLVVPLLGILIYLLFRPAGLTRDERESAIPAGPIPPSEAARTAAIAPSDPPATPRDP